MSVTLCDKCENLTPEQLPKLMANETEGWRKEIEHFQAKVDYKKNLSIIDVPALNFDEKTKASLMEVSVANDK